MDVIEYDQKLEIVRRYREAKEQKAEMHHSPNVLSRVTVNFEGEEHSFTLSGNEMACLLSEFPAGNIEELFYLER